MRFKTTEIKFTTASRVRVKINKSNSNNDHVVLLIDYKHKAMIVQLYDIHVALGADSLPVTKMIPIYQIKYGSIA